GDLGHALLVFALALALAFTARFAQTAVPHLLAILALAPIGYLLAFRRPLRAAATALSLAAIAAFVLPGLVPATSGTLVSQTRSFFGVSRVLAFETDFGIVHRYLHGDTTHNLQMRARDLRTEPLAYYADEGPFGDAVRAARIGAPAGMRVGVIGL